MIVQPSVRMPAGFRITKVEAFGNNSFCAYGCKDQTLSTPVKVKEALGISLKDKLKSLAATASISIQGALTPQSTPPRGERRGPPRRGYPKSSKSLGHGLKIEIHGDLQTPISRNHHRYNIQVTCMQHKWSMGATGVYVYDT